MQPTSRRQFFAHSTAATISALAAGDSLLRADPLGMPIGCQTYPVRKSIARDFPGTIKQLAAAGFQSIELCSPVGYADAGFAPVGRRRRHVRALVRVRMVGLVAGDR